MQVPALGGRVSLITCCRRGRGGLGGPLVGTPARSSGRPTLLPGSRGSGVLGGAVQGLASSRGPGPVRGSHPHHQLALWLGSIFSLRLNQESQSVW